MIRIASILLLTILVACQPKPPVRTADDALRAIEQASEDFMSFCLAHYPDAGAIRTAMVASAVRPASPTRDMTANNRRGVVILDTAGIGARLVIGDDGAGRICGVQMAGISVDAFNDKLRATMEADGGHPIVFDREGSDRTWWRAENFSRPTMFVLTRNSAGDGAGAFLTAPDAE